MIEHNGIVVSVHGNTVRVEIEVGEACNACASRGRCSVGQEDKSRIVDVVTLKANEYSVGERVVVAVREFVGMIAVVLGYIVPLVILIISLIFCVCVGTGDLTAALISMVAVAVYYVVLYVFRRKISKKVSFTISKFKR